MKNRKKRRKKEHKYVKFTFWKYTALTLFVCALFVPGYVRFQPEGENVFHVSVNGIPVGTVGDPARAEELLWDARYQIASRKEGYTFLEAELSIIGEEMLWGYLDSEEAVRLNMLQVLEGGVRSTLQKAYTVKVKDYLVNLNDQQEVEALFQAAIDKYDESGAFQVKMVHDPKREFSVFTLVVEQKKEQATEEKILAPAEVGAMAYLTDESDLPQEETELEFDEFDYGVIDMDIMENIEVIEAYLPSEQIDQLDMAVDHLVREQEVPVEYTIVSGDTLSEIALKVNVPVDTIVEMNRDLLDNANSRIYVGDKLIITVPEPELSVTRRETKYYEEIYDADTVYIDNNDWYTNQSVVLQQPSAGFRKIAVQEVFVNDKVIERNILKQELVKEAVALVVERGTKIPPSYIKPLSGGRISSNFGPRKAPMKGASTNHPGVDWSTPVGTTVVASCGGTVSKAGWANGYGYCVFIEHEDGKQTRYGHLSKVLVKVGQKVKQGEKIALSGNTGNSTGPHLHFEIRVGGSPVNPLNYVSR